MRTKKEKHVPLIKKDLFDACQKTKAIRALGTRVSPSNEMTKPFMNLMRCGSCNHFVTGEVHKKKRSGKVYIYYHYANHDCPQRRINVRQEVILQQLKDAFRPFTALTPKTTKAFIENIKEQLADLNLYTSDKLRGPRRPTPTYKECRLR